MRFEGAGFRVSIDSVNGWAFLHSFEGKGNAEALQQFVGAVSLALSDCTVFCTVDKPSHAKFYERIGFKDTGSQIGGSVVMSRPPMQELS